MLLVTIDKGTSTAIGAILQSGEILDFSRATEAWRPPASIKAALTQGVSALDELQRAVDHAEVAAARERLIERGALLHRGAVRLAAPIPDPGLVISMGATYRSHLEEMNIRAPERPLGFIKNTNSIIGPDAPIRLPSQFPTMVDFEGEFSAVFGRPCHNVRASEALDYVAGYVLINDVSARNWVQSTRSPDPAQARVASFLNTMGKQFPTFCPLGPAMATVAEIPDPHDVELVTTVDGRVMQSANTRDLIFTLAEMISHMSRWYEFRPGDVITTGSPAGVGYARTPQCFLRAGQTVTIAAKPIGALSNPVIGPEETGGAADICN